MLKATGLDTLVPNEITLVTISCKLYKAYIQSPSIFSWISKFAPR